MAAAGEAVASERLRFCIHGAGGLGSLIGARLAKSGHSVVLIGRAAHMAAIRTSGLKVEGRDNFVVEENLECVLHPAEIEGELDFYILLTKAKGTEAALRDAQTLIGRVATAVTLQNGVEKEGALVDVFGSSRVIGGSIVEGGTLIHPGCVRNHVTAKVTAYFGELSGQGSRRTEQIADAFTAAGLSARAVGDIRHVLWEKVVQVGGASAWSASTLAALPRLDFVDGLRSGEGAAHYVTLVKEMLAVYHALGYSPQNFFAPLSVLKEIDAASFEEAVTVVHKLGERLATQPRGVRTSMHEDVLAARKTEIDVILRPIVEAARRLDVPAPTLTGAYRVIKTLDQYFV